MTAIRLRGAAAGALYEAKTIVARYPALAIPLERARKRGQVIGRHTDIVIEGFPRCASSFVVAAFRSAQEPRLMTIAHHTHMPAQVIAGVRRGIPTLVLIRRPEDAIVSQLIRSPDLSVGSLLRGFVRFYSPLAAYRSGFVVGAFDEAINDLGGVIRRLNERFGTGFAEFIHSPENLARIDREIELDFRSRSSSEEQLERIIPRPSSWRASLSEQARRRVRNEPSAALRLRAKRVYDELAGPSDG